MKTSETSTIYDLIVVGNTVDLTYYKTSLHEMVGNIQCVTKNIFHDYLHEIKNASVVIRLNNEEYIRYAYKPKVLSHDIYGSTDLSFLLMMLNDINNEKDFDFKTIRVLRPSDLGLINKIYNAEKKYLVKYSLTVPDTESDDNIDSTQFELSTDKEYDTINDYINELRLEFENIKRTILDLLESILNSDIQQLIADLVDQQMDGIRNTLEQLVDSRIAVRIQNLLVTIENVKKNIENKIDVEVEYIYEELYDIRTIINEILAGGSHYNEIEAINNRLREIENTLSGIMQLITDIIDQKLDERLFLIIQRIEALEQIQIPTNLQEQIDVLKLQVADLKSQIDSIVSDNCQEALDHFRIEFDEFKEQILAMVDSAIDLDAIKSDLAALIQQLTKEIVFVIQSPELGIQYDTELLVPYKGNITKSRISIGVESLATSNIIVALHRFNTVNKLWIKVHTFNIVTDKFTNTFDLNIPIDNQQVRFVIENGDLNNISNMSIILTVKQTMEE